MIYNGNYGYLNDLSSMARQVTAKLRPHISRFDFIAVTGMSGVIVGSPVSLRLRKPLVVIRKPEDATTCHQGHDVIGELGAKGRYLFLDDFISFGDTFRRVRVRLDESDLGFQTRYVGTYLYSERLLSWEGDGVITYTPTKPWGVDIIKSNGRRAAL